MKKIQCTIRSVIFIFLICIIIIGCSVGNKSKHSEESLAIEAYKSVLQNKNYFYSQEDDKNILLEDFLGYGGALGYDAWLDVSYFTILDMDGDRISEVVLDLSIFGREWSDFREVLHYEDGIVYGYLISHQDLEGLKSDGTFIYSGGAGDWGIATFKFTSDNYEYNIIGYCESDNKGISYFIDNNQSTEEAFDTFCNEQEEKSETEWYEFSRESVEVELSSDKID